MCIFTTHTPVEAGHDRFPYDLVERLLGAFFDIGQLKTLAGADSLNMTRLALGLSGFVNGAAKRHARSEEHTSELQSLMRKAYAVFCFEQNSTTNDLTNRRHTH